MKKIKYILYIAAAVLATASCKGFLDVQPTNKVSADAVVSSPEGIQAFLANLYYNLPIEGFDFTAENNPCPDQGYADGFHFNDGAPNNSWRVAYILTDEALGSELNECADDKYYAWWGTAFRHLHDLNAFADLIPTLTSIDEATRTELMGQAWFIRGMIYFALARRYGGLPIIEKVTDIQPILDNPTDTTITNKIIKDLKVSRSTEVETWNYILKCFDNAAEMLSETDNGFHTRANKWTALAYKSRASLHAASLAKYADAGIFVVRQDYAPVDRIKEGVDLLADSGLELAGCMLNYAQTGITGYTSGYGYGYGGRYGGRYGRYGKYGGYGQKRDRRKRTESEDFDEDT